MPLVASLVLFGVSFAFHEQTDKTLTTARRGRFAASAGKQNTFWTDASMETGFGDRAKNYVRPRCWKLIGDDCATLIMYISVRAGK
jgi:hypothetical protein